MGSLDRSVAFISGAGRGVGRAIAIEFARHGARVAAQDISPVNLEETMRLITEIGSEALELVGDMSKKMQVQGMIEAARDELGEIDILINQGTVAPARDLLEIDEWDWDRTLGVNLKGYFLAIQSIGRLMSDRRQGLIMNVVIPPTRFEQTKQYPAYEVSAAGIRGLTQQAGRELDPYNVKVFAIEPAWRVETAGVKGKAAVNDGLTWWQRAPGKLASVALDLCLQAEEISPGMVLKIGEDGSVHPARQAGDRRE
jgi:NAD(P)-dependent dehydrogenase (short-subunit alcohol dehydrogenase family)